MDPLISCIIPVYNVERYLGRCMESILAQDYHELEIILIDDGSTDASGRICDTYSKAYGNVHVFHIPNGGASLARKTGLEYAKGEYVTFVDSDDFVSPDYVSSLYTLIEKYGTRISACGVSRVKEGEQQVTTQGTDALLDFDGLMRRFFKYEFWGFGGGLYHRDVFQGLTFPKATLCEDYYVKTQIFFCERQLAVTSQSLYFYEYHENSLSHTKLSERAFDEFDNVKAVYEFVLKQAPQYTGYALSNVTETIVKLFSMSRGNFRSSYSQQYAKMSSFLQIHQSDIRSCSELNKYIKLLAQGYLFAPSITSLACKFI